MEFQGKQLTRTGVQMATCPRECAAFRLEPSRLLRVA